MIPAEITINASALRDVCTGVAGLLAASTGWLLFNRRWLWGSFCLLASGCLGLLLWGAV